MKRAISYFTVLVLILSPCAPFSAEEGGWEDSGWEDSGWEDSGWEGSGGEDTGGSDSGWDNVFDETGSEDAVIESPDAGTDNWGSSDEDWGWGWEEEDSSASDSTGNIWSDEAYNDWYEENISSNFTDQMSEYYTAQEEEVTVPENFGITTPLSPDDPESLRGSRDMQNAQIRLVSDTILYEDDAPLPAPEVILTWQGETLIPGIDYELYYEPVKGPGYASVTAIGLGLYAGERPLRYQIRLASPTLLMASPRGDGTVHLHWNKVPSADAYRLYRRTKSAPDWQVVDRCITDTGYIDTCSEPAQYSIRAVKGMVLSSALMTDASAPSRKTESACSTPFLTDQPVLTEYRLLQNPFTKPAACTLESAQCREQTKVSLFWSEAEGAGEYVVLRRQKDSDIWQKVQTMVGADMIGCLLPGTDEFPNRGGMTYYYTVASYDPKTRLYGDCSREGLPVTIEAPAGTSDAALREAARAIIEQITTADMSQSAKLAACWNYCMCKDFIPSAYPDETQEGWKYQCAYDLLTGTGGNCYGYAHGFAALARELGYTPYVVVIPMTHCFVLIDGGFWDNMGNKMGAAAPTFSYTADQISLF